MGKTLYIFSSGTLKRKDNTLLMTFKNQPPQFIPIETVDDILVLGEVDLNKSLLELLTEKSIPLHFFSHYGTYTGTYYPRENKNSSTVLLAQAAHWLDEHSRLNLAAAFVLGAIGNMRRLIMYYQRRHDSLNAPDILDYLEHCAHQVSSVQNVPSLLGLEGTARSMYYQFFDRLIQDEAFFIVKRVRRPPSNPMNALISFVNSLCYAMTLSQIYRTRLDPRISFLHSPSDRRISLNLDLSEIFKPLLVDRLIFSLVNRHMIHASDFSRNDSGGIYASEAARRVIVSEWEKSIARTVEVPSGGRKSSWRGMVRLEAQKVQNFITGSAPYEPFIHRW